MSDSTEKELSGQVLSVNRAKNLEHIIFFLKTALSRKDIYIYNTHIVYYFQCIVRTIRNKIIALGIIFIVSSQELFLNSWGLFRLLQVPFMAYGQPVSVCG